MPHTEEFESAYKLNARVVTKWTKVVMLLQDLECACAGVEHPQPSRSLCFHYITLKKNFLSTWYVICWAGTTEDVLLNWY